MQQRRLQGGGELLFCGKLLRFLRADSKCGDLDGLLAGLLRERSVCAQQPTLAQRLHGGIERLRRFKLLPERPLRRAAAEIDQQLHEPCRAGIRHARRQLVLRAGYKHQRPLFVEP